MPRASPAPATTRVSVIAGALALTQGLIAMLPRALSASGASIQSLILDAAPSFAIVIVWIALTARSARSPDALWALPSDLFRAAIVVGGATVGVARLVSLALPLSQAVAPRTLVATTIEEVLFGLGVVALGALAAFALARTALRPALRDGPAPAAARDITLRTRFIVASTGVSFATAGVLLDVLVDFERTSDVALAGYILTAAALVAFAAVIGWLVGDDTARGIESVARRMREITSRGSAHAEVALLAADEIGELAAAATQLERRLRLEESATSAARERERIARELHDGVAKSVSILALDAATIAGRAPETLRPELARIERLARLLSEELRAIVKDVRAPDAGEPFAESLTRAVHRHSGAIADLSGDLDRIGTLARFEILRMVDEGLRNAVQHAHARHIAARIAVSDGHVLMEVEDDGSGMPEPRWDELAVRGRYGLIGMRERAALLSGTLTVASGRHGGTLVRVEFPLANE
jgi:two-component system sensor histidine kinase UhpB